MRLLTLPRLWITTFIKKEKKEKFGIYEGLFSVLFSSLIIGIIFFCQGVYGGANLSDTFITNIIILPVIALICLIVFAFIIRILSAFLRGKGSYSSDCGIIGTYSGSLIFIGGLVSVVLGYVLGAVSSLMTTPISFTLLFAVLGIILGILFLLFLTVYGIWRDLLSKEEKLDLYQMNKVCAISVGVMIFILCVVLGVYLDIQLGPYMDLLRQYGSSGYGGL